MTLDLYVGTLTRYYTGHWQTTVQQQYAASGQQVRVFRGVPTQGSLQQILAGENTSDSEQVRPAVLDWCRFTEETLRGHFGVEVAFDWDESMERPYYVDMPQRSCLESLRTWAEQHGENDGKKYLAIRASIDWWLPCLCPTFQWRSPLATPVTIGSSLSLLRDLIDLNTATWQATPETLAAWYEAGPPLGASTEDEARFALCVIMPLAATAVRERLPMLLDE